MFNLESKACRHLAGLKGYEVDINVEEKFITFKNTNFGMVYYPDCREWEILTNYNASGEYKIMKNSFNGTYNQCVNKIIQLDQYFKSKNKK